MAAFPMPQDQDDSTEHDTKTQAFIAPGQGAIQLMIQEQSICMTASLITVATHLTNAGAPPIKSPGIQASFLL
jgi:hypothetical protein